MIHEVHTIKLREVSRHSVVRWVGYLNRLCSTRCVGLVRHCPIAGFLLLNPFPSTMGRPIQIPRRNLSKISSCARRLNLSLVRKAERSTSRAGCSYFTDDRDDPTAIATSTSPLLDRSLSLWLDDNSKVRVRISFDQVPPPSSFADLQPAPPPLHPFPSQP